MKPWINIPGQSIRKTMIHVAVGLLAFLTLYIFVNASAVAATNMSISGHITDANGTEVESLTVTAYKYGYYSDSGSGYYTDIKVADTQTDTHGNYVLTGLSSGTYKIKAGGTNSCYDSRYYDNQTTIDSAEEILLSTQNVTGKDFVLPIDSHCGSLAGTITLDRDGRPVSGVLIKAYAEGTDPNIYTDTSLSDGTYLINTLPPGTYLLEVDTTGTNYIGEFYDDVSNFNAADPVNLSEGENKTIDIGLTQYGSIQGTVTDSEGNPVQNAEVELCPIDCEGEDDTCLSTRTSSIGTYFFNKLFACNYKISFSYDEENFIEKEGTQTVQEGETTEVPFVFKPTKGTISGRITDGVTGQPIEGLTVRANLLDEFFEVVAINTATGAVFNDCTLDIAPPATTYYGLTESDGSYRLEKIPPGTYRVWVDTAGTDYIKEYHDKAYLWETATPVNVLAAIDTTDINFALTEGAKITGKVINAANGQPLEVTVAAKNYATDRTMETVKTGSDGVYTLRGLPTGAYKIFTRETEGMPYEYYNDTYDADSADPVIATARMTTKGIDFSLEPPGLITGRITNDMDGTGIAFLSVVIENLLTQASVAVDTDSDGNYTAQAPSGTYLVYCDQGNYIKQYYRTAGSETTATPVAVSAESTAGNIDISLVPYGTISGIVTQAPDGMPKDWVGVNVVDALTGTRIGYDYSDAEGIYMVDQLPPGRYKVYAWDYNYNQVYYSSSGGGTDLAIVVVTGGTTTPDIDILLPAKPVGTGKITGTVTYEGGMPCADISVRCGIGSARTASDGTYALIHLPAGEYEVSVYDSLAKSSVVKQVSLEDGETQSGIDLTLTPPSGISGTLTEASDNSAIAYQRIYAYDAANGKSIGYDYTDSEGHYLISDLSPGNYHIKSSAYRFLNEYYDNVFDVASATPVSVTQGKITPGIDLALGHTGSISGTISRAVDNLPIATYTLNDLIPGEYMIKAKALDSGYQTTYYADVLDAAVATPIIVASNEALTQKDIRLALGDGTQEGTISGIVTRALDGLPLAGIKVSALDAATGNTIGFVHTKLDGSYAIKGLLPGEYKVTVLTRGIDYLAAFNGNVTDADNAAPITVTAGNIRSDVDFSLKNSARITGMVTHAQDSTPISRLWVYAESVNSDVPHTHYSQTRTDGSYTIAGLQAGDYLLDTRDAGTAQEGVYQLEYYNDVDDVGEARSITVAAGQTTPAIDFDLTVHGKISGTVSRYSDGFPLPGVQVHAWLKDVPDSAVHKTTTLSDGSYCLHGLADGTYVVKAVTDGSVYDGIYVPVHYDDAPDLGGAAGVSVSRDTTAGRINLALQTYGCLSGLVTDTVLNSPLVDVAVTVYDAVSEDEIKTVYTNTAGEYVATGLLPGTYKVVADKTKYLTSWHGASDSADFTTVTVNLDQHQENINIALELGGSITGNITDAATNQPVCDVRVDAIAHLSDGTSDIQVSGYTDCAGNYSLNGLNTGPYSISAYNDIYVKAYYKNAQDLNTAAEVTVTKGQTTPGINMSLTEGGKIAGTVTRVWDGLPMTDYFLVYVYDADTGERIRSDYFHSTTGAYLVTGLPSGSYKLKVDPWFDKIFFVPQYYGATMELSHAFAISVAAGHTQANIDVALPAGGAVSGVVTRTDTGKAVENGRVYAYGYANGIEVSYDHWGSSNNGEYCIGGLPAGDYLIKVKPYPSDLSTTYYENTSVPGRATAVTVTALNTTPIDFTLHPDGDRDGLPDALEKSSCTDGTIADTDKDGLSDGIEDANRNGQVDVNETDPCNEDTDNDGILDGAEDANHNGTVDAGETDPLKSDTDGDGIPDGQDSNPAIKGDVNGDISVTLTDALIVCQILAGKAPSVAVDAAADVNGDCTIGIEELIFILKTCAVN